MATHSSILAREIPWTEDTGRLQSMGSQSDTTERLHFTLPEYTNHPQPLLKLMFSFLFSDKELEAKGI